MENNTLNENPESEKGNNTKPKDANKEKTDPIALLSFILGLTSILLASVGIVPWTALILGLIAISRTKEKGTGRWMAVIGIILGTIYALSNAYMYGHFDDFSSTTYPSPAPQQITQNTAKESEKYMTAEPVGFERKEYTNDWGGAAEKYTISVKFTNKTDKTITAFKTRLCVDTVLGENALCENIQKYEVIVGGNSKTIDFSYDSSQLNAHPFYLQHLKEIKEPSNLKVTLNNLDVVYGNDSFGTQEDGDENKETSNSVNEASEVKSTLTSAPVTQKWSTLKNLSGTGITKTQTFNVSGSKVRITATVNPSHEYTDYSSFRLECNNCGRYYLGPELPINTFGGVSKTDSTTYSDLPDGEYFVSVNSMAPNTWSLLVEEYK